MGPVSIEGLLLLAGWPVVAVRLVALLRQRRRDAHGPPWQRAKLLWVVLLAMVVSGTVNHPLAMRFFQAQIGEWFGPVPRVLAALSVGMLWAHFASLLNPNECLARLRWPYLMALCTGTAFAFLLWIVDGRGLPRGVAYYDAAVAGPIFEYVLLLIVVRIVLPLFHSAVRSETHPATRLRFQLMTWMHYATVVLILNDLVYSFGLVLHVPYDREVVFRMSSGTILATFVLAYFPGPLFFQRVIRAYLHVSSLLAFPFVRLVELQATRQLKRSAVPVRLIDALRAPDVAIYRSAVSIFDLRKMLHQSASIRAWSLGEQLDRIAESANFPDIVQGLQQLGRRQVLAKLRAAE